MSAALRQVVADCQRPQEVGAYAIGTGLRGDMESEELLLGHLKEFSSDTARGQEIIGILTHLTDTSQNTNFHDKYFAGLDLDLSGALFIFSYNDEAKINPILRDRMHKIETKGYTPSFPGPPR